MAKSKLRFHVLAHFLLDRAENILAAGVTHLNAHAVAEFHKGRLELARVDLLDHPHFLNAGISRLAVAVRDRARTDQRSGAQLARLRGMGEELGKGKIHISASVRLADEAPVPVR